MKVNIPAMTTPKNVLNNSDIKYNFTNNQYKCSKLSFEEFEGSGDPFSNGLHLSLPKNFGFCVENTLSSQGRVVKKNENNTSNSNQEVVFLNGHWDTTNKIPNIVTEMHNVKFDEFQTNWMEDHAKEEIVETKHISADYISTTSPQGSDSGFEGDCAEGNLSWLLNYKIHELPPVPDSSINEPQWSVPANMSNKTSTQVYIAENIPKQYFHQNQVDVTKIYEEQRQLQCTGTNVDISNSNQQPCQKFGNSAVRKPPFTYTELIEHALREKGELTVSGIYQWISDHFPYYKVNDDRWKNSVRHNLSINPHFRKGGKAVHGAGHLWTLAQPHDDKKTWQMKKQRMQQFLKSSIPEWSQERAQEIELANATASIMQDGQNEYGSVEKKPKIEINICSDQSGKAVEVEYINCIGVTGGYTLDCTDFLIPAVPKEQMAEEFGLSQETLQNGDYLITDLNPAALGLQMTETEIITGETLFADDMNFQTYELHSE